MIAGAAAVRVPPVNQNEMEHAYEMLKQKEGFTDKLKFNGVVGYDRSPVDMFDDVSNKLDWFKIDLLDVLNEKETPEEAMDELISRTRGFLRDLNGLPINKKVNKNIIHAIKFLN